MDPIKNTEALEALKESPEGIVVLPINEYQKLLRKIEFLESEHKSLLEHHKEEVTNYEKKVTQLENKLSNECLKGRSNQERPSFKEISHKVQECHDRFEKCIPFYWPSGMVHRIMDPVITLENIIMEMPFPDNL